MDASISMAKIAALIADPSRAMMLCSLAGDERRPASELAILANVSPQTASRHLALLVDAGLLTVRIAGRNKFYRLRGPEIAAALESLAGLSGSGAPGDGMTQRRAPELVFARTCYDHLAGILGVAICERALSKAYIRNSGKELHLTSAGKAVFSNLGIETGTVKARRRFAYPCIDWSQRLPHIGGALGVAILDWLLASKAIARCEGSRAVRVTNRGIRVLEEVFAIQNLTKWTCCNLVQSRHAWRQINMHTTRGLTTVNLSVK